MQVDHKKNIVEINNVSFAYGKEDVLKDITFSIHQGDYLGLIGPNGAGKTTLLKIILGLLTPSEGYIRLFGKDLREFNQWNRVGYVPQKAVHFDMNFPITVLEVVTMGRFAAIGLLKLATNEDKKMVEKALHQVGMWEYKDSLIGDLSQGQQQRVLIARALAGQPEIIFLDEPTASIDKAAQDNFYRILKDLNEKEHITIVLITHDIERITKEAMHIACVDCKLVCHASPQEFLRESKLINVFGENVKIIEHQH